MIGASDLIPSVAPLVTFASVIFSVAVYLERNDEIGKLAYNAAVLLAALTIVFGLAFVVFISISENMTHIQSLKSLIAFATLTGLLAAFVIGFGIIDSPSYTIGAGVILALLGLVIRIQQVSTNLGYVLILAGILLAVIGLIFGNYLRRIANYLPGIDIKTKKPYSIQISRLTKPYSTVIKIVNRGSDKKLKIKKIKTIDMDGGGDSSDEFVMLENTGNETVDLTNYTIQIDAGEGKMDDSYNHELGETKLDPNAQLRLFESGTETIELYLNKDEPVLSNDGNVVTVKSEDGGIVDDKEI